jgi:hypothetical protein
MNKKQYEQAVVAEMVQQHSDGEPDVFGLDIISGIRATVAQERSEKIGYKLANAVLSLGGVSSKIEMAFTGASSGLYPALAKLERGGVLESDWQEEGSTPRRRIYRLAVNPDKLPNQLMVD